MARCATHRRLRSFPRSRPTATHGACPKRRWARGADSCSSTPIRTAGPLEEFLGTLPAHFARWDFEHRYLQAHVAKKVRCNWKVAQEAFDEGLHLGATHPQSAPYVGDANAAVDIYGNYARQISPSGTPIEDLPMDASESDILKRMLDVREGEELPIPFSQRTTARDAMAAAGRERWRLVLGDEADDISDAELVDHWNYAVFPELPPVGWLQPDRLPIPSQRRPARRVHLRGHVPHAVSAANVRRPRRSLTSASRTRGRRHQNCRRSGWSWSRTPSTWRQSSAGSRRPAGQRWSRRPIRRASCPGGTTCSPISSRIVSDGPAR